MNTVTAHPVAPEEIMALLDGELSAAEAQAVSGHLGECAECANLAEQFRATTKMLAGWSVPAMPFKLEDAICESAARALANSKMRKPPVYIRTSIGDWRLWAIAAGGGVATMVMFVLVLWTNIHFANQSGRAVQYEMAQSDALSTAQTMAPGPLPVPSPEAQPSFKKQPFGLGVVSGLATPDSSRLYQGLGDHVQSSLSVGGPLSKDKGSNALPAATAPMIARTVSLMITAKNFAASRASIEGILARHHGYSAQLAANTPENAPRSLNASLRIPAPELALAVGDLKTLGRVENESQSGEEVTQQHADLVERLKTARETEERFRAILGQRTGNVSEVLQVEEGIARVRGEIENMEAEQKQLEHRVDFATVDLQLSEEYQAPLNSPSTSLATRFHNAFVAGYRHAAGAVLGIILFFVEYGPAMLIWLTILALPVFILWRRYRRVRTRV